MKEEEEGENSEEGLTRNRLVSIESPFSPSSILFVRS